MPVLFFGNIDTYCTSALRVLTVGLNPSSSEFPNSTFQRFERYGTERRPSNGRERRQYLEALSGYFCGHPYREWFDHLETLLNEIGASYYGKPKKPCTALHTDICSPVATQLRWSDLEQRDRDKLREDGAALWKALLQRLEPDVVLVCVADEHLSLISFEPVSRWGLLHVFDKTAKGKHRRRYYRVTTRRYSVGSKEPLFVFCPNGTVPVMIGENQKQELGKFLRAELGRMLAPRMRAVCQR